MKKHLSLAATLVTMAPSCLCATEAVGEDLQQALKVHPHNEPGFFSIILSLLFVIGLIYITGVIYSKLNIVGAKTLKEHLRQHDLSNAIVLSTTQLGQGKNLHIVEIEGKRMLIGATPSSINLIKELEIADIEESQNYKATKEKAVQEEIELEEFDLHKKYL